MRVSSHPHKSRLLTVLALVALPAFAVSACGSDDDESTTGETASSGDASAVTVAAEEYDFTPSATPTADTKEVTLDNQGKEFHVLIFAKLNEGFTVDEAVELEGKKGSAETIAEVEAPPGQSKSAKITKPIEPGDYVMLCPISGPEGQHYKLGQLEEFTIE